MSNREGISQGAAATVATSSRRPLPELWTAYGFVLPAIILLVLVLIFPLIYVLYLSLGTELGNNAIAFVGLANYAELLSDAAVWNALNITLVFTVASVAGHMLIGLGAALLLNRDLVWRTAWRVVALLPWMFAPVVVGVVWRWIYNTQFGILNDMLLDLHLLQAPVSWLGDANLALPSLVVANLWRGFPFVMIMALAGLQAVPREVYEAAAVDGASAWQQFRYVTIPEIRYILMIAGLLDAIWTFRHFDLVQVLTGGGPANRTEVLTTLVYRTSFEFYRFTYASAIAVVMFLILLLFTIVYLRVLRRGA